MCGAVVLRDLPYTVTCHNCQKKEARRWRERKLVLLLGVWRGCTHGAIASFSSLTSSLLVQHGFSIRSAGAFAAAANAFSLMALPAVAAAAKVVSIQRLLEANTMLLAAAAAMATACETLGGADEGWAGASEEPADGLGATGWAWWAPHVSFGLLALGSTTSPVLLLALVPTLGRALGPAYGELETLSVAGQAGFALLFGAARTAAGFHAALWALLLALLAGCAVARAYRRAIQEDVEAELFAHSGGPPKRRNSRELWVRKRKSSGPLRF